MGNFRKWSRGDPKSLLTVIFRYWLFDEGAQNVFFKINFNFVFCFLD